jgi:hypothetical protein
MPAILAWAFSIQYPDNPSDRKKKIAQRGKLAGGPSTIALIAQLTDSISAAVKSWTPPWCGNT